MIYYLFVLVCCFVFSPFVCLFLYYELSHNEKMVVGVLIAIGVTFLLTGATSYYAFHSEPTTTTNEVTKVDATANIKNHITMSEKPDIMPVYIVTLLIILILFKVLEFGVLIVSSFKRSLKKKYSATAMQQAVLPTTAQPAQPIPQDV